MGDYQTNREVIDMTSRVAEDQRYGRNKETTVSRAYLESGEYRNKFDKITDNKKISRILYQKAKKMLLHRSGTMIEDMYWIDRTTGDVVACVTDQTNDVIKQVKYPNSVKTAIRGRDNLIAMHTHPESMPPSIADFNSVFYNNQCHLVKLS